MITGLGVLLAAAGVLACCVDEWGTGIFLLAAGLLLRPILLFCAVVLALGALGTVLYALAMLLS